MSVPILFKSGFTAIPLAIHCFCDGGSNYFRRFDEVLVGKVGVARCRPMAPMPE